MDNSLEEILDKRGDPTGFYINDITKAINVDPKKIVYGEYFLPNSTDTPPTGRAEWDDITARLTQYAERNGQWVAVSSKKFREDLVKDIEVLRSPRKRTFRSIAYHLKRIPSYVISLVKKQASLYGWMSPLADVLYFERNNSLNRLYHELRGMENYGLLDIQGEPDEHILSPTYKLIRQIKDAQRLKFGKKPSVIDKLKEGIFIEKEEE